MTTTRSFPRLWPLTRRAAASIAAGALATMVSTQATQAQSQRFLGLTQVGPLVQQHNQLGCNLGPQCPVPLSAPPFLAGASAWDGTSKTLWLSDGATLSSWDPDTCSIVCPPIPSLSSAPTSGLTVVEASNTLYELDQSGVIQQWNLGCPLTPGPACTVASIIGSGWRYTSLAADELAGLMFIGAADPVTGNSIIQVSQLATPCNPFSVIQLSPCGSAPLRLLTGLVTDNCAGTLYATDGYQTVEINYTFSAFPTINFTYLQAGCCSLLPFTPTALPYAGLAIRPRPAGITGNPCSTGACLPCVPQIIEESDPIIGNPSYTISMVNAPGGAIAWVGFNLGGCTGFTTIPPFCAPLRLPISGSLTIIGPVGTGGTVGSCDGIVSSTGPIPLNPALCGVPFSAQGLVFCPSGGTAVTGCMTTAFQGL